MLVGRWRDVGGALEGRLASGSSRSDTPFAESM